MNIRLCIALALSGASLSACNPAPPPEEAPLTGARIGGAFTLTDQRGTRVSDTDFAGKYRLVYFGYTFCPDVCPVDMNRLMLGLTQFERNDPARGARIAPIFITVDPQRDTPEVVGRFVAQFHPRITGLTGTAAEIADIAGKYLVRYERVEGSRPDAYLIGHTQLAYLMGPDGKPVALLPIDDPQTDVDEGAPALVAAELARWVR